MKAFTSLSLAVSMAAGISFASSVDPNNQSKSPDVLQLPIFRDMNRYVAEISVGTPPQIVNMTIDIGSAFTWLLAPEAGPQGNNQRYNNSGSSTYKPNLLDVFSASRNGHHVQGHSASETLTMDGVQIPNIQISTVQNSTLKATGIIGLGYANEGSHHRRHEGKAQSFLDSLAKEGAIHHKAYSLHLEKDTETGTILFGGTDTLKFHGPIKKLPIVPQSNATGHKTYNALQVMMTSLELGKNRSIAYNNAAILDPSSRISHLPKAVFKPLLETFRNSQPGYPAFHFEEINAGTQKIHTVDCKIGESLSERNVTFGFGGVEGAKIDVPLRNLVLKAPGCSDDESSTRTTQCLCFLAFNQSPMVKSGNNSSPIEITVLGDAILRYSYVVYDLQDHIIGMARRNFESSKSNIVELGKGGGPAGEGMKHAPGIKENDGAAQQMKEQRSEAVRLGTKIQMTVVSGLLVLFGGALVFA